MALTIHGRADSSNVQAVMWCVGELGLDHLRVDVGHRFGGNDTDEFRAMNPNGLVPVVIDDGAPIFESAAILRYLSARYGSGAFWPDDAAERAQIDKWAEWVKTTLCPLFTVPLFWGIVRTAPSKRDLAKLAQALDAFHAKAAIADAQLGRSKWLAGDSFSLADILLGHLLFRYYDIDLKRADLVNLRRYYDRLTERPAYRQHVMISYAALAVTD